MKKRSKITAIFLGYNAEKTLERFYKNFPKKIFDKIILVDDASKDRTFELAKKLGITSYRNAKNLGYGGNMKRAFSIALKSGADVIVDIHPDGEYKTSAIIPALKEIDKGAFFVLGNRFYNPDKLLKSGMFIWKYFPIKILNALDRLILGIKINDCHQGFRVYTKKLLEKINYKENSQSFLFSFEIIAQAAFWNLQGSQVPVDTRYTGRKRGATLRKSIGYSLGTFWILILYMLAKLGFKIKIFEKPRIR
jgi:glycosyltransferase involved in cell wall biosynthesis